MQNVPNFLSEYLTPTNVAIAGGSVLVLSLCGIDVISILLLLMAAYMGYMFFISATAKNETAPTTSETPV